LAAAKRLKNRHVISLRRKGIWGAGVPPAIYGPKWSRSGMVNPPWIIVAGTADDLNQNDGLTARPVLQIRLVERHSF